MLSLVEFFLLFTTSIVIGDVITRGFTSIRQSGESISVMIILEDKQIAYGDCAAVQYSGAGGRDPVFLAKDFIPVIEKEVKPRLVGREANNFKELCSVVENIRVEGKKLHTAIRYGVTQAILDAVSKSNHCLMCQVIAKEYNTDYNLLAMLNGMKVEDYIYPNTTILVPKKDIKY